LVKCGCCTKSGKDEGTEEIFNPVESYAVMPTKVSIRFEKLPDEKLGIEIETLDRETVLILEIKAGAFRRWNKDNQDRLVSIGDKITEVNGVAGDPVKMLQELKSNSMLNLEIKRCKVVQVQLKLEGRDLGMSLVASSNCATIMVKTILPGAISEWNAKNTSSQVQEGDRIYMVNNQYRNLSKVLENLQSFDILTMSVWTYPYP